MSRTLRIEGQRRIKVLMEGDVFRMEHAVPMLEYPYVEADKAGKERERLDRLVVVRYITDGKPDDKPSVAIIRDQDWKALQADLLRMKHRRELDTEDLDSWFAEIIERSVRVYEQ